MLNYANIISNCVQTWIIAKLFSSMFAPPKEAGGWKGVVQILLLEFLSVILKILTPQPIDTIVAMGVFSVWRWYVERRLTIRAMIQIMLAIMITKVLAFISIFCVQIIFTAFGYGDRVFFINMIRIIPWLWLTRQIIIFLKCWDVSEFCERYALAIESGFFLLVTVSYAIVCEPVTAENTAIKMFALLVILVLTFALVMWTLIDQKRHKKHVQLTRQLEALRDEAHRYKEKVPAVERELRSLKRKMEAIEKSEVAEELEAAIETASAMRKQMEADTQAGFLQNAEIPSTGLPVLNEQLANEQEQAAALGITFACEVLARADAAVNEAGLPEHLLMQVLGDLYRNAERAVMAGTGEVRQILLTMGHTETGYRFTVSDTGVPFAREVLETIGTLRPTADGHGHGMAHICGVLSLCGASLEVDTEDRHLDCYTKDISVVLDGKAELRIRTGDGGETCRPLAGCGNKRAGGPLKG